MALGLLVFVVLLWIGAEIVISLRTKILEKEKDSISTDHIFYKKEVAKVEKKQEVWNKIPKYTRLGTVVLLAIIIVFSSFYTIDEQHIAVVTTFGKPEEVTETGLHFKIPFIQKVKKVNSTIQGVAIGYTEGKNETDITDSLMITSDFNFVNVDFYVEYKVTDAIQYLYGSSDPEGILKNISQSCIRNTIGMYTVDSVLTTGKSEIQSNIKDLVIKELGESHTGLSLINITIQDSEPPTQDVLNAFQQVEQAKQNADEIVNNAEKYENEQLPTSTANADEIKKQAEAKRQERIDEALGEVSMFNAMYEEYIKDPDITKMRIYYESMEELMPNLQIIVNGTDDEIKPIIIKEQN